MSRPLSRSGRLKALLLGWSSIGRRRVVPALAQIGITRIDVASRSRDVVLPDGIEGTRFQSYEEAIAKSDAELVYVSTRNQDHARLATSAIESERHVVVDKPVTINYDDTHRLAELADAHGVLIAEATVWPWHPQIPALLDVAPFHHVTALFSFPPMPPANFRMGSSPGGGMLWDLGPYVVSAARLFFRDAPERIEVSVEQLAGAGLDSGFSVLMRFHGERTLLGHFGMHTAYINRLIALAPDAEATLDRAFTTTPDQPGVIVGQRRGEPFRIETEAADPFALFLMDVQSAIVMGRADAMSGTMLRDAAALRALRLAAGVR